MRASSRGRGIPGLALVALAVAALARPAAAQSLPIHPNPYLYRVAGPDHLYTTSGDEVWYALTQCGYSSQEGVESLVWNYGGEGRVPVYRLFRGGVSPAHYYTSVAAERDHLATYADFTYEGIAFWVYPNQVPGTYPLYRMDRTYSPAQWFLWWKIANAVNEDHVLTMRSSELAYATQHLNYHTNQYWPFLIGYAMPGWLGVD